MYLKKKTQIFYLLLLFLLNNKLISQIIYTDIPDTTPNATYTLDLNNDTIDDFIIQYEMSFKLMCYPLNNNAYLGEFNGSEHLPWALSLSNSICNSQETWYDSTNPGTLAWGTSIGHWIGETNKYLALKINVGTNTYYGWARLDLFANSGSFTLKDYAYESTPNTCIDAGQTILGINENVNNVISSVLPNPFNNTTTIQTVRDLNNVTLTIYNSFGKMVKQVTNISGQSVSISRDNLISGLYLIRLSEENRIIAIEKLLIID